MSEDKPRVRFCWECGRKLQGNSFKELKVEGHDRILHKVCAQLIENNRRHQEDPSHWPSLTIDSLQQISLVHSLKRNKGDRLKVAQELGISRAMVSGLIAKYKIEESGGET
jgi:transcriptional regulator with AAA-type ATPase domain